MSTQHTPEPWNWHPDWKELEFEDGRPASKYLSLQLCNANGDDVIPLRVDHYEVELDYGDVVISEADRARIVTCVNALSGVSDPAQAIAKARDTLRAISQIEGCMDKQATKKVTKLAHEAIALLGEPEEQK